MARQLNLRQVEAFKAVIENGTVSSAALTLNISQPAISKLLMHLEAETRLQLFDRVKGRLAPTERGMRLYEEIERIFAGVRQVESAVEAIRREEQGKLEIGVMPALSGAFIQQATTAFLSNREGVFCSIQSRSSEWIADWLVTRKLDVGVVSARVDNPYLEIEPLFEHGLVCIMPPGHPLTAKRVVSPKDLDQVAMVSASPENYGSQHVTDMLTEYDVQPKIVLISNVSITLCEFVAGGLGVALVHPLIASGHEGRVAIRRFEPAILNDFRLCHSRDSRNAGLVKPFILEMRNTAERICRRMLSNL